MMEFFKEMEVIDRLSNNVEILDEMETPMGEEIRF